MERIKKSKKWITLVLSMLMFASIITGVSVSMTANVAVAEVAPVETVRKQIMLGTDGILSPEKVGDGTYYKNPQSYIHFGTYTADNGSLQTYVWRVLDVNETEIFLLSEYLLGSGVTFNEKSNGNDYLNSQAQTWCANFAQKTFSETVEAKAMLSTTKTETDDSQLFGGSVSLTDLSGDTVFFLSAQELAEYVGNKDGATGLAATNVSGDAGAWWLRSYNPMRMDYEALYVDAEGEVSSELVYMGLFARPAMKLDSSKVLYTFTGSGNDNPINGGNSNIGSLVSVSNAADNHNHLKLTLLDDTRKNFNVTEKGTTVSVVAGEKATLHYTGAVTDMYNYISVILTDEKGNVTHYGRIKETSTNSGDVNIPTDGLEPGTYKLKVFNEYCKTTYKSNYASAFSEVTLTVTPPPQAKMADSEGSYHTFETLSDALVSANNYVSMYEGSKKTIEITSKTLTINENICNYFSPGVTIKTYGTITESDGRRCGVSTIEAIDSDVTLGTYKTTFYDYTANTKTEMADIVVKNGKVKVIEYRVALGGGGNAIGVGANTGVEITNTSEEGTIIYVYSYPNDGSGYPAGRDSMEVALNGKFKIGEEEYENVSVVKYCDDGTVSDDGTLYIGFEKVNDKVMLTLEHGSIKLKPGQEIAADGKIIKNTGDVDITVTYDAGCRVVVPAGKKVTVGKNEETADGEVVFVGVDYKAGDKDATFKIEYDGNVILTAGECTTAGSISAQFGEGDEAVVKAFVTSQGNTTSYIVNASDKTLTVPANLSVTNEGVQFTNGTFTFGEDDGDCTVTVSAGASVTGEGEDKDSVSTIIGVADGNTTVSISSDDGKTITLISGKGQSGGEMMAYVGDENFTFKSYDSNKYTVDTAAGTLTLNDDGSVIVDNVAYFGGYADKEFKFSRSNDVITVIIPEDAFVRNGVNDTIAGVAAGTGKETKVEIDDRGNLTLLEGKGIAGGPETVNAKMSDGTIVEVKVPSGVEVVIDLDSDPSVVRNLSEGETVTIGGVTYTAVADSSFPLKGSKLTKVGEKAVVSAGMEETVDVQLGENTDYTAPVVNIPSENHGIVTIEKTENGGKVTVADENGQFMLSGKTYTAGYNNAEFTIDKDGNVTRTLSSGEAKISDGDVVVGVSGKPVENPADPSDDTITVKADAENGKDIVTVPAGGKVKIDGTEYENASNSSEMTIEVPKEGDIKLIGGTVKLDKDEEITVGTGNVLVKNTSETSDTSDTTITVTANTDGTGNASIQKGGKATINKTEIAATEGDVSVDIDTDGALTVKITTEKVTIGGTEILSETEGTTVKVDKDGKITVIVPKPGSVTIGGKTYTYTKAEGDEDDKISVVITADGKIALPKATAPDAPTISTELTYGQALSKIELGGDWEWVNGKIVPRVSDSGKTAYSVKIKADDENYDWSEIDGYKDGYYSTTVVVTVKKATYNMAGATFGNGSFVYDGKAHGLTISGTLPSGVSVTYEGNEKTESGVYTVTAKFSGDSANYNLISDKVATLTINAKDIKDAIVGLGSDLTYNGSEQTKEVVSVTIDGLEVTYTVSGNKATNAGAYTLTVTANGNFTGSITKTWSIAKAKVTVPGAASGLVYTGSELTGVANGDLYTVTNGKATNAGSYTATVTLNDAANYEWSSAFDGKLDWSIAKATYDMSGVKFDSNAFVYDGKSHSLAIGTLPSGVTVTYENNDKTEIGTYTVTAKFSGDSANYNAIADMTATLTIRQAIIENVVDGGDASKPNVIVSEKDGIDPNVQLVAVKQEEVPTAIQEDVARDEIVAAVYEISLKSDGVSVQPNGDLTIRLLIPDDVNGKTFRILHLHEGKVEDVEYTVDGDYAVFTVDKLSEFSIVVDNSGSALWLIIVLAVIVAAEIVLIVLKKRKTKGNKLYAAGLFGGVIPVAQIVWLVVLGVAAVALGAYVVYLYLPKKNAGEQNS